MKKLWKWFMKIFKLKHLHRPKGGQIPVPIPDGANFGHLKVRIQLHGLINFSEAEKRKIGKAIGLGDTVLNSLEFKEMVSNYTFSENRGMTGQQIWELICTGKDLYNPISDNDIDVFVTMYENFWTGTIGYTFPNTFKSWMNRKFFRSFDETKILGNVMHEAMHNFGFDHKDYENRFDSVPYKIGYLARDLGQRILDGNGLVQMKG